MAREHAMVEELRNILSAKGIVNILKVPIHHILSKYLSGVYTPIEAGLEYKPKSHYKPVSERSC